MTRGTTPITTRRCPAFSGANTKQPLPTRRLQQQLRPGCRQAVLPLPGMRLGQQHNRLAATPSSANMGHLVPAAPSSWRPGAGLAAAPRSSTAAAATWGGDVSFTAATKLQQQQYVRHVQHNIPGSRSTPAPQPQWQSFQTEARNRNKGGNNTEPVFSYQQLFDQDMTPTYNVSTSAPRLSRQGSQSSSSKGFSSKNNKARRSGGSSSAGGSGAAPSQPAVPGAAHVQLCITKAVEFGQNMRVTGSGPDLGSWNADKGPKLRWSEGHKWTADVTLPSGGYEFKFLLEHRSGHLEWENGTNRSFTVPKTAAEMLVEGDWGSTQDTEVLELQQQAAYRQQTQKLQQQADEETVAAERDEEATARAEAAAFAAANKAAAAAYQQQADAEAAAEAVERRAAVRSAAEPARPPADLFKFDLNLLDSDIPGHAQLMQVLLGFRHDMVEGLTGVTSTMQEIQEELSQVQNQMQTLAAERFLTQTGPVDAATAEALESGAAVSWTPTADTAAIIAADAAVAQDAALSGLQGVVTVWQQELMNFREDSHGLRDEMEMLRLSLEQQMADNTGAVQHLESQIRQLMALQGIDMTSMPPRPTTVVAAAAVAPPPPGVVGGRPSTPGSGGPPGSSEMLDPEDKLLLERINHLASDLSEEMKEAVQELELQQQSLLERHQHIIADMSVNGNSNNKNRLALDLGFGAGLGMRMQPTMGKPGVLANGVEAGPHVTRAVARWLESHNVQQYHQGLLVAVLISCGLWRDSMWEPLENGALRATFNTYKSVWSEACLQTWKDNITTKQALMTALSTGRQQLLSMHILWSLQELCTHCGQLHDVLPEVATPIELGLMQKLRQKGGAGQGWALGVTGAPVGGGESAAAAQCAVLLQRWLAAADGKW